MSSDSPVHQVGFAIIAVSMWILGVGALAGSSFYDPFYATRFSFGEYPVVAGIVLILLGTWAGYHAIRGRFDP